eukprot:12932025-Prorocentrum_lima.AAC.1
MRTRAAIDCKHPEGSGGSPASASPLGERFGPVTLGDALALGLDAGAASSTRRGAPAAWPPATPFPPEPIATSS